MSYRPIPMERARARVSGSPDRGYCGPAYAASLCHMGEPFCLPRSGGALLVRPIPGADASDARAPYPLLDCEDWAGLAEDLAMLAAPLVSAVAVPDPLRAPRAELERAFPDLLRPFKRHSVVELGGAWREEISRHHRQGARRARRRLELERMTSPHAALDEWCRLYSGLMHRHAVRGAARFPRESFERQLRLPQLAAYRALADGRTVALSLLVVREREAYYHLAASDELGRKAEASYGLLDLALEDLERAGVERVDLGGVAGLDEQPDDGLSAFKRGWTPHSIQAFLAGRVLDPELYERLSPAPAVRDWFPAYRRRESS